MSRRVIWRARPPGSVVVARGSRRAIRRASAACRSGWCRRRPGCTPAVRSASGALRRSRRAPERPGEPAWLLAWGRSTPAARAMSGSRPRRVGSSRRSAARARSVARPAGQPSARSEDRPQAGQSSCVARVARQAGRRPGAVARALARAVAGLASGSGWIVGPRPGFRGTVRFASRSSVSGVTPRQVVRGRRTVSAGARRARLRVVRWGGRRIRAGPRPRAGGSSTD